MIRGFTSSSPLLEFILFLDTAIYLLFYCISLPIFILPCWQYGHFLISHNRVSGSITSILSYWTGTLDVCFYIIMLRLCSLMLIMCIVITELSIETIPNKKCAVFIQELQCWNILISSQWAMRVKLSGYVTAS